MKPQMSLCSALILISANVTTNAWALPDPRKPIPLTQWGILLGDTGGAKLLLDDKEPTLYVGPKAEKTTEGTFAFIGGSISCADLDRMRSVTYRYPEDSEVTTVVDSGSAYSPAFDANFGIMARSRGLLERIAEAKLKSTEFAELHKSEYGAYVSTRELQEVLATELLSIDASLTQAQQQFSNALLSLPSTLQGVERDAEITRLREFYVADVKDLNRRRTDVSTRQAAAMQDYVKALRSWAPFRDKFEMLNTVETSLSTSYANLQALALSSLERSQTVIEKLELKPIGTANVAYNILGDEVDRVREVLTIRGAPLGVAALPIFDVQLNSGVSKSLSGVSGSTLNSDYSLTTLLLPASTRTRAGEPVAKDSGFTTAAGQPISLIYGDDATTFGGSGAFETIVNQGAYCGAPTVNKRDFTYVSNGKTTSGRAYVTTYESPRGNVLSQAVALKYKFYAKAEPISGACTIKVGKMADYWRTAGSSKSWSFRGSSSRSWDDSKLTYRDNMGLDCNLKKRPIGPNAAESQRMNDALEKALYDDMFAMFVMQYGKEYKLTQGKPPATPGESHPLASVGTAVLSLCGSNPYCAVTGIVLKGVDELVGARHSGSTSSAIDVQGTIGRSFDTDGYFIAEGTSTVNMIVKASN